MSKANPMIINKSSDFIGVRVKGEWWDDFEEYDPHTGLLLRKWSTLPKTNVKMDKVAELMAALMANEAVLISGGILQHAQGRGDGLWNEPTIPAVTTSDLTLVDEAGRKVPSSIVFLDLTDTPVAVVTSKIRISTTLLTTDLVGVTIREQALFGGDATATIDSGFIINVIRHAPIFKSGAAQLTRNIKLTFS